MNKFSKSQSHRFGAPPPPHLLRANFETIRVLEKHKTHAKAPIYRELPDNPFCPKPCEKPCAAPCEKPCAPSPCLESPCLEPVCKDEHKEGEGVDLCALYKEPEVASGENPQNAPCPVVPCTNVSRFLKRQTTTRW